MSVSCLATLESMRDMLEELRIEREAETGLKCEIDKEKFEVTVGCDQKDKIDLQHEISLTDDLSKFSDLFDVVIDFSLPEPSIKTVKTCEEILKPITIGTTGFSNEQKEYLISAWG